MIRLAQDHDSEAVITIIADCYALYDNCVLDLEDEEPGLRAVRTALVKQGTTLWVLEEENTIHGCIGLSFSDGKAELKKFYVSPKHWRRGYGQMLYKHVEQQAAKAQADVLYLWTDTRFLEAHSFYKARGLKQGFDDDSTATTRLLFDKSDTEEFYFEKALTYDNRTFLS